MDYGTEIGLGRGLQDASQTLMQLLMHRDELRRQQAAKDEASQRAAREWENQLAELKLKGFGEVGPGFSDVANAGVSFAGSDALKTATTPEDAIAALQTQQDELKTSKDRTATLTNPMTGERRTLRMPYAMTDEGKAAAAMQSLLAIPMPDGKRMTAAEADYVRRNPSGFDDIMRAHAAPRVPTIDRAQIEDPGYVKDGVPTPAIVDILSDGTRRFVRRMTPEEIKKATHIPGTETPTEARTRQESLDTAEAWFNAPRPEQESAQLNTAFGALRAAHKDWSPQRIMRSLMQAAQTGGRIEATSAATQQREQKAAEDALFSNIMQQSGMNIPPASPMVRPDTSRSRAGVAGTVQNPRPDATTTSAPLSALPPSVDKAKYLSDPVYRQWVNQKLNIR